ncbi:MAG: hypothetical protein ABIH69_03070 [bacterium]|nr:hypothetical protein [Candidatus Margulisiibacteriota bacterium]
MAKIIQLRPQQQINSSNQLRQAFKSGEKLLRQAKPESLAYDKNDPSETRDVKWIVLMSFAAQAKYAHIYTEKGLKASFAAFELYQYCTKQLKAYPDPVQQASRDSMINFLYTWCIITAGNRPKNYQARYFPKGATMSAKDVKNILQPHIATLAERSLSSHPLTYYVIDRLLIFPQTGLPFNIYIPY